MNWIKEWFLKAFRITKNPKKFFNNHDTDSNIIYPVKFAVTS